MRESKRKSWTAGVILGGLLAIASPAWSADTEENVQTSWGKDLFVQYCASCHGEDGKGNGPAAEALKNKPADLTKISANRGGQFPRAEIMRFIDGERPIPAHGPRHMPVWGEVFRDEKSDSETRMRIHSLVAFIESIQQ